MASLLLLHFVIDTDFLFKIQPQELNPINLKTSILEAIADCDMAFEAVERKSFIDLLSLASNGKTSTMMVKADAMKNWAVQLYLVNLKHLTARAREDIKDVGVVHFTNDCWSSPGQKYAFLGLIGHWITPDFKMKSLIFGLEKIKGMFSMKTRCILLQQY